jgi:hypothetical protein
MEHAAEIVPQRELPWNVVPGLIRHHSDTPPEPSGRTKHGRILYLDCRHVNSQKRGCGNCMGCSKPKTRMDDSAAWNEFRTNAASFCGCILSSRKNIERGTPELRRSGSSTGSQITSPANTFRKPIRSRRTLMEMVPLLICCLPPYG